ncbi:MAG TPA: SpoIID/LytB domain-containing protein [Blastocatellia bacterium]|nr:SpoIID/LytB domain-containing protein [Blastocatellia bacterium]
MCKLFSSARLRPGAVLVSVLVSSGWAQPILSAANARQKPATSRGTSGDEATRQRTVGDSAQAKASEPLVRIALMTDVTSVVVSSRSGVVVNRSPGASRDDKKTSGPLRIELRQPSPLVASSAPVYRISVRSTDDPRRARKLADDLGRRFKEQAAVAYNSKEKEYDVVIGRFTNKGDANAMVAEMRRSGYADARIVTETNTSDFSSKDVSSKPHKAKSNSDRKEDDRSAGKSAGATQIAAFDGDRLIASSDERLVVVAANSLFDISDRKSKTSDDDDGETPAQRRESKPRASAPNDEPRAVRIGAIEYRGEVHLLLNRRGRINVINAVPMEEYLRGVVPMELPPGPYPAIEALKAQAVAARTYAIANRDQHAEDGFDIYDDPRSQVYAGLTGERALSDRAVEETRGMIAVFKDDSGHARPIQALYSANCGGRTENNEVVFGGAPLSYLRGVACAPDSATAAVRDIATNRIADRTMDIEDRSVLRGVALLDVLGLHLPSRVTASYLRSAADQSEATRWVERVAKLTQKDRPSFERGDATRLPGFARLVAAAIYGEGRASLLLTPADVDYLLAGLGGDSFPREARADLAMLLKDGVLVTGALDSRAVLTRAQIIETLARALTLKSQSSIHGSQISGLKSQISDLRFQISDLRSGVAQPSDKGRVILAAANAPAKTLPAAKEQLAANNTSSRMNRLPNPKSATRTGELTTREITARPSRSESSQPTTIQQNETIEVEDDAWLFRSLGGASYAVGRLSLIGGERIIYHVNSRGRIDFLEAWPSERGASSDRFSSIAEWTVRVTREEMEQRLARSRVEVGKLESIEPIAFSVSNRVTEVEVRGDEGRSRLRGRKIIGALGLRENLFVVDTEKDALGDVVAFVFTGRGWGHGVGMCQTGAFGLAKEGYSYTAILQKYYTGIKVQRMY